VADDLRREARALVESRRRWRRHAVCARYRFVVGGLSHGEYVTASRGWVGGLVNLTMPPATTAGDQSRDRSRVVSFNPVVMPISRTLLYAPLLTEIPMPEREHSEAWLSPMPECSARQQRLRRWEAQEAVYAMRSSVYPCDAARHARRASTAGSATGWGAASASLSQATELVELTMARFAKFWGNGTQDALLSLRDCNSPLVNTMPSSRLS
jgi:hypothetical protein